MRRVLVMGMAGAGKSTLAIALGRATGAPVHHLDAHYWKPGWVASSPDDLRQVVLDLVAQDRWVLDGNYRMAGLDERLARADAVVVMVVPRRLAMWRVVRRSLRHRGRTRPDLGQGNPERLNLEFLRWVWNWERNHPDFVGELRRRAADTPVVVVRNRRDAERLLVDARGLASSRGATSRRARR